MSEAYTGQYTKKNDWVAQCDVCGIPYFGSTMRTRWDGLFVDDRCWEPYPDGYKSVVIKEKRNVPVTRPIRFNTDDNQLAQTPRTDSNKDVSLYVVEDV